MSEPKLMDRKEYIESLQKLHPEVYLFGEKIEDVTTHPMTRPHVESAALTYEMAHRPEYQELMIAESHLFNKPINRFTHIHQNTEDLVKKVKMLRMLGQKAGSCFQRCVGLDALNGTYCTTYDIDKKYNTDYHKRLVEYLKYVQKNDLMLCGAMSDPKGERNKLPHEQEDPDLYLHVVDRNNEGIIVRGAKVHMTGIVNSHEIFVMPTKTMTEKDKDYALSFAVPVDDENIIHIFGRQTNDLRKMHAEKWDQGNFKYGMVGGEALTVFNDVFVPWDRVFMCGEYDFTRELVETFASYHRSNYGGCKVGICDLIIGAVSDFTQQIGTSGATHIRNKVAEMIRLEETLYTGSIACAAEGSETPSGAYFIEPLMGNIVKYNVTEYIYELCRIAQDITGGILATLPSEKDFKDEKIGKYVKKYLMANPDYKPEERFKVIRLIENLTGGTALVESMHGAGSPQAQKIMMLRRANLPQKIKFVKEILAE